MVSVGAGANANAVTAEEALSDISRFDRETLCAVKVRLPPGRGGSHSHLAGSAPLAMRGLALTDTVTGAAVGLETVMRSSNSLRSNASRVAVWIATPEAVVALRVIS